ncbi:AAA family ATPase [Actinomarinicola tropica]|uniref:AAA domain-containing protein n=1 Tax=Actinomarinicola tropica TaxID=2789776 RepID=A0A5Q2RJ13_9ACTN|nr:MoxR family ATPase [Actinomarinicola tropica]QGG96848.1 AAA domain-containing protein [Actinomarinicola tropica]
MTSSSAATVAEVADAAAAVVAEVERAVIGKRAALELVLAGWLADGHVLIEDLPGLAKTLLARSFATVTGVDVSRVQFTPDLMPADVTGSSIWDPSQKDFVFRAGPIFTHLLLGDEINRAPPKTQAALLEAMAERQVTIDGTTHPLPRPFLVIATQNPVEFEGTYPLPEAQMDRFLLRVRLGYPDTDGEIEVLRRRIERKHDDAELRQVVDRDTFLRLQAALEEVHVAAPILDYVVALVEATRVDPQLQTGASPRGSLALVKLARAAAALAGRDFVTPSDVQKVAVPALAHRLILRPELWVRGLSGDDVVAGIVATVPTPAAEDHALRAT